MRQQHEGKTSGIYKDTFFLSYFLPCLPSLKRLAGEPQGEQDQLLRGHKSAGVRMIFNPVVAMFKFVISPLCDDRNVLI